MDMPVRDLLRKNVPPYEALGLAEDRFSDDELIDAMLAHPILINRPIVVTPLGTKLCRPSEVVLDILPISKKGPSPRKMASWWWMRAASASSNHLNAQVRIETGPASRWPCFVV